MKAFYLFLLILVPWMTFSPSFVLAQSTYDWTGNNTTGGTDPANPNVGLWADSGNWALTSGTGNPSGYPQFAGDLAQRPASAPNLFDTRLFVDQDVTVGGLEWFGSDLKVFPGQPGSFPNPEPIPGSPTGAVTFDNNGSAANLTIDRNVSTLFRFYFDPDVNLASDLDVSVRAQREARLNGVISGDGALNIDWEQTRGSGGDEFLLGAPGDSNPNTYTGGTTLSAVNSGSRGEFRARKAGALGTGDVTLNENATLILDTTGSVIGDTASVFLTSHGGNSSKIDLSSGLNETVGSLFLDGAEQAVGTYGATGSGAQFIRDDFFTGDGLLTVSSGVAPPSTFNWTGGNATGGTSPADPFVGLWSDTGNWDLDGVPDGVGVTAQRAASEPNLFDTQVFLDQDATLGTLEWFGSDLKIFPGTPSASDSTAFTFANDGNAANLTVDRSGNTLFRFFLDPDVVLEDDLEVSVKAQREARFNGVISGDGGLTIDWEQTRGSGGDEFLLGAPGDSNPNTYAGGTILNAANGGSQGEFRARKAGALGTGDVTLNENATLILDTTGSVINDSANLFLTSSNGSASKIDLSSGTNESVGGLFLDGLQQAVGTYGATGSGAQFINDDFFTGNGVLTVGNAPPTVFNWTGDNATGGSDPANPFVGLWTDGGNWSPGAGFPSGAGVTAQRSASEPNLFDTRLFVDQDVTVGSLIWYGSDLKIFGGEPGAPPFPEPIPGSPSGSITFDNNGSTAIMEIDRAVSTLFRFWVDADMVLADDLDVSVRAQREARFNGIISGDGQLIINWNQTRGAGGDEFLLGEAGEAANTYSGGTILNALNPNGGSFGEFRARKAGALGTGDVRLNELATLILENQGDMIGDLASVYLVSDGIGNFSTLDLAAGLDETIGQLYFDGVEQAAGTYGASGSGAMFINDDFFAGLGILRVIGDQTPSPVIPEPATATLLGLTLLGLSLRRSRN